MSEFEILKTAGPAGMGIFAIYLFGEKIVNAVRSKMNSNGNISHNLLTQELFKTMVEMNAEMKAQTKLLQELVDKY